MTELSMFTEADQVHADKEINCYGYLHKEAIELMIKGEFGKAAIYHQNIARSLDELERLKRNKQMNDKAGLILKQIEGERRQKELLYKLSVNIYE